MEVTTVVMTRDRWADLRGSLPHHRGPVVLVDGLWLLSRYEDAPSDSGATIWSAAATLILKFVHHEQLQALTKLRTHDVAAERCEQRPVATVEAVGFERLIEWVD